MNSYLNKCTCMHDALLQGPTAAMLQWPHFHMLQSDLVPVGVGSGVIVNA